MMEGNQVHRVDEVLFSFTYNQVQMASHCNAKLHRLMAHSIVPELENSFDQVSQGGLSLDIERLEIDLGALSEEDISEDLGGKIRQALVQALKNLIRDRVLKGMGNLEFQSPQSRDFSEMALKVFFLKGYFPDWLDSRMNLPALLSFLISHSPKNLRDIVLEVSVKSESARKRIAYLDAPYFDQIIGIMIPEDAEWVIGYRNTYMDIHQTESNLPGSSENLEKALNLFILTFITRNSGTKFNRLSFSDRFLKSIAAHYNLDFKEFLQEITEILRQNTIENQLFRDFRDAITWVGEKNQLEERSQEKPYVPNFQEMIAWLENPGENKKVGNWVENQAGLGVLPQELFHRFPGFWNSLSKSGLTFLIKLMGQENGEKWLEITYSYLALSARFPKITAQNQLEVVREILDLASEGSFGKSLALFNLEDWYYAVAFHAFGKLGTQSKIVQDLLTIGFNAGISHPSVILIQVKNRTRPTNFGTERNATASRLGNSDPTKNQGKKSVLVLERFQVSILRDYLDTGFLSSSFRALGKSDLQAVVAAIIKSLDPVLINLIRSTANKPASFRSSRILELLGHLSRKEVFDYISRFAGPQTHSLMRFNEQLIAVYNPGPGLLQRLDREIWTGFIAEIKAGNEGNSTGLDAAPFRLIDSYISVLSGIQSSTEPGQDLIKLLQRRLNLEKSFLVYFELNRSNSSRFLSRLEVLVSMLGYFYSGHGLLGVNLSKARKYLQKGDLNKLSNPYNTSPGRSLVRHLSQPELDSISKLLLSGRSSVKDLAGEAKIILAKDLDLIRKSTFSIGSDRLFSAKINESVRRVFIFFLSDPEPILEFFQKNKSRLPWILYFLNQNLKAGDWGKFSGWVQREFPLELKVFQKMQDQGYGSVLDSQISVNAGVGAKSGFYPRLDLVSSRIKGSGWKISQSADLMARLFSKGLPKEVEFLFGLQSKAFYKASVSLLWRKAVLLSAFQTRAENELGSSGDSGSFWVNFLGFLKEKRMVFGPENLDWNYLLNSGQLEAESKALLVRFFKQNYLKSAKGGQYPRNLEAVATAIQHLKEEGFLPWWSPVKSKSVLVFSLVTRIEYSKKEDALLLVHLISKGNNSVILNGISWDDLVKLRSLLATSLYKRHYSGLIRAIESKLEKIKKSSLASGQEGKWNNFNKAGLSERLKNLTSGKLDQWIKKQVNSSREKEVLSAWFAGDSKIQKQLEELLSWSRFMFFGNLNPGKWKNWVLGFAFDYYIKKGNAYTPGFIGHFLGHLTRSRGLVNWKAVFHQLLKTRDFPGCQNTGVKNQILALFPSDPVGKSEEISTGDQVKISNAGLILCWPFLSVLFSRLKLSSGGVLPAESQPKAVFLLQYLAYGHYDFPEYELVLNKVLVGMKSSSHLEKTELTNEEMEMADSLLQGIKNNWEKMKNASPQAIRETFLQREGILEFGSASNILRVTKTGVDVLLDSVTWNISVIRLPWMEKSLEVKWR